MTDQYNVNRIHSWPDGSFFVEVVAGIDSGDPGRLGIKYRDEGEGENYTDPRCAAIAAVRIQRSWLRGSRLPIGLVHNGRIAGEMGVPGQECSARELFMWARKEWLGLPRCARCGDIIGGETFYLYVQDEHYCSEYCAEEAQQEHQEEIEHDNYRID